MAETLNISKTAARAYQVWPLLVWAAKHRQILTYKDLDDCTGLAARGVGNIALGPILRYCKESGYPPLTAIVVNSETWLPGEGWAGNELKETEPEKVPGILKRVFQYDWREQAEPPTPEILEELAQQK
ncbi:MAG: hypothetical protein ACR2QC_11370 [Gammaproteobacteria bacterium]